MADGERKLVKQLLMFLNEAIEKASGLRDVQVE